jgi:hypothetical protein
MWSVTWAQVGGYRPFPWDGQAEAGLGAAAVPS